MRTIRINLELPEEYRERTTKLQERLGASSQAEVFRKAIGALEVLNSCQRRGGIIQLIHSDGVAERLRLI